MRFLSKEYAGRHTSHIEWHNDSVRVCILSNEKELKVNYTRFMHDFIPIRVLIHLHLCDSISEATLTKVFSLIYT